MLDLSTIEAARSAIDGHVLRTPLVPSAGLSDLLGTQIWCKAELLQPTGSYKVRGVTNLVLGLDETARQRGLIAFSAGNLAMAVAYSARQLGVAATVCMPAAAVRFKVDAVRSMGASVELVDGNLVEHVTRRQHELGAVMVHPFESPELPAGYASAGCEIIEQLSDVDTVLVPVGGGGLIGGVAAALKALKPSVRVIGVEPEAADVVRRSRAAGAPVAHPGPKSLADGLAAPVTSTSLLALIDAHVDELVTVGEADIAIAWQHMLSAGKWAAEPSGAVGVAALLTGAVRVGPQERVVLVVSGGNFDLARLSEVLATHQ